MKQITSAQLREMFQSFMETKGHRRIQSASVIPENDPTVLFTTAGMHPLVPYLLGEKHPSGKRLTDVQKCVRTEDIDEVGDDTHCTFFEMLGSWSLGDYFKKERTKWSYFTIKNAYDEVLDFLVLNKPFGTGELRYSSEGKAHFEDCKILFDLNFYCLLGSFVISSVILLLNKLKKIDFLPKR